MSDDLVPVVAVRLAEGRSGSTMLMQLLATAPGAVFDDRYPSEYRFLSYFARMAAMMTEPFDEGRHVGVTPFFFGGEDVWGPVPFESQVVDPNDLARPLLQQMWAAWSSAARRRHPQIGFYAEKIAVEIEQIHSASIPVQLIDLVRDPRDVLASIRAFTAKTGLDGFGRTPGIDEPDYVRLFIANFRRGLETMLEPPPPGVERITVRYEDLCTDLHDEAARIGAWLDVELDPARVEADRAKYAHHITSTSPSASVGRWQAELSPSDTRAIEDALRDLAAPFGYTL